MRKIFTTFAFILIFSVFGFGQTESVICPTISVDGPYTSVLPGELVTFTAFVTNAEKYKIKYEWSVDEGEIIEGQGTSIVKVKTGANTTRATVEIIGLPAECKYTTASDTTVPYDPPFSVKLDEYSIRNNQIEKERLDILVTELQSDPTSTGLIVELFKKNVARKIIEQKKFDTLKYLREKLLSKANRVIIKICEGDTNSTQIWRIPVGAEFPEFENCEP